MDSLSGYAIASTLALKYLIIQNSFLALLRLIRI